jgi:medium-chain acyl-[acyl-carrier-protein] hydrolase
VSGSTSRWLVSWPSAQGHPRLRLVCIPHAGAGAALFRPWRQWLPDEIDLCALRSPGRESRLAESPIADLEVLTQEAADALEEHLDGPYALFGICSGAIVAFELAREFRRRSAPLPSHLVVAAQVAPDARMRIGVGAADDVDMWERVRKLGGTDPAIFENPQMRGLLEPALRADFHLTDTYRYVREAPLDCPLTAFVPQDDTGLDAERVAAWGAETSSTFQVVALESDHFFSDGMWRRLGETVARCVLDEGRQGQGDR